MGDVVIVTDKPQCLEQNLGTELLGGAHVSETDDMIVYPGVSSTGKVYVMKQPSTKSVKVMKKQKARAWIHVHKTGLNPSMIVYMDQDIVIGKDINIIMEE